MRKELPARLQRYCSSAAFIYSAETNVRLSSGLLTELQVTRELYTKDGPAASTPWSAVCPEQWGHIGMVVVSQHDDISLRHAGRFLYISVRNSRWLLE